MFLKLFFTVFSIFLMMGFGFIAKRLRLIDTNTIKQMSQITLKIFYPALILFSLVSSFTIRSLVSNLILPVGTIIIMSVGFFYGLLFSKSISFASQKEENSFRFQCTMNNYTFLSLPIVLMLWGNKGVGILIFSNVGSELCIWTLGVLSLTGSVMLSRKNLKHILSVPLLTIVLSFIIIFIRDYLLAHNFVFVIEPFFLQFGKSFMYALDLFGKASIPIAMFISGGRISELKWEHIFDIKGIYLSVLRLIIIPATSLAFFYFLPLPGISLLVISVVAIMPSAIASVYLSEIYDSDVNFSSKGVLLTHLFSLITIPIWLYFIIKIFH
ncbi:MAG: AEC family transporter [Candidatus Omnitrophica bacterium]|jgi:predicted permease|nr:AEC family transporter [Candidatus Omnitrophota bacterium]